MTVTGYNPLATDKFNNWLFKNQLQFPFTLKLSITEKNQWGEPLLILPISIDNLMYACQRHFKIEKL